MDQIVEGLVNGVVVVGQIVEGLVIGVGVSISVGFAGWLRHRLRRRKQIGYFRKLIVEGHEKFHRDYSSMPVPEDARRAVFDETYREVQAALQGRSDDMTFDQIHGIKRAFFLYEWAVLEHGGRIDQAGNQVFDELSKQQFLKLPSPKR